MEKKFNLKAFNILSKIWVIVERMQHLKLFAEKDVY